MPELKTVLPNADFVIEGYVDPTEPLRDEVPFGDHTGPREVAKFGVRSANYFNQPSVVTIPHSAFII